MGGPLKPAHARTKPPHAGGLSGLRPGTVTYFYTYLHLRHFGHLCFSLLDLHWLRKLNCFSSKAYPISTRRLTMSDRSFVRLALPNHSYVPYAGGSKPPTSPRLKRFSRKAFVSDGVDNGVDNENINNAYHSHRLTGVGAALTAPLTRGLSLPVGWLSGPGPGIVTYFHTCICACVILDICVFLYSTCIGSGSHYIS